jgi:hypothetical protein
VLDLRRELRLSEETTTSSDARLPLVNLWNLKMIRIENGLQVLFIVDLLLHGLDHVLDAQFVLVFGADVVA